MRSRVKHPAIDDLVSGRRRFLVEALKAGRCDRRSLGLAAVTIALKAQRNDVNEVRKERQNRLECCVKYWLEVHERTMLPPLILNPKSSDATWSGKIDARGGCWISKASEPTRIPLKFSRPVGIVGSTVPEF